MDSDDDDALSAYSDDGSFSPQEPSMLFLSLDSLPDSLRSTYGHTAGQLVCVKFALTVGNLAFKVQDASGMSKTIRLIIRQELEKFRKANKPLIAPSDFLPLGDAIQAAIDRLTSCCLLCGTFHAAPTLQIVPCTSKMCMWQFTELGVGRDLQFEVSRSPRVTDLLISMTYMALNGPKRDENLEPFPLEFMTDGNKDFERVRTVLDALPSVKAMSEMGDALVTKLNEIDKLAYYLVQWILNTNRTMIEQELQKPNELDLICSDVPDRLVYPPKPPQNDWDSDIGDDTESNEEPEPPQQLPGVYYFRFAMATPEKERTFAAKRKKYGTRLVFHGSHGANWHSIIRHGLLNLSNTGRMVHGAAYGPGIYLGGTESVSLSYTQGGGSVWTQSELGTSVMLVCELAKTESVTENGEIIVAPDPEDVLPRFLYVLNRG